jgi:hypothetical protein
MAHFGSKPEFVNTGYTSQTCSDFGGGMLMSFRSHRTDMYGSFTVLALEPNCTHVQKSLNSMEGLND